MNVYDAILKRRSIRKYKTTLVEDEKVELLLKAAMAAPSAKNTCNWKYYVVTNKEKIAEISKCGRAFDYNPPLMIIVGYDLDKTLTSKSDDFAVQDCSAAIENILVEAVELGLGTVWCGIYPVVERVESIRKVLDADDNFIPLGLVEVGYPDEEKESRTQFDDNKIIYIK